MNTTVTSRIRLALLASPLGLALVAPASAQPGATVREDGLRKPVPRAAPLPPARPAAAAPQAPRPVAGFSRTAEVTFDEGTYDRINGAMLSYEAIEIRGGWPTLPAGTKLAAGDSGPLVALLRQRLAVTEDIPFNQSKGDSYDQALVEAVKRFQVRHGLPETGTVGPQTLDVLNVPVGKRLRQLAASRARIANTDFRFAQRYVVVNIPSATVEAIADGRVARRYVAVVGKADRPSPPVTTRITAVNLNPTWTVPLSILKKDIVPKMRKDPGYVSRMRMRLLDAQGGEIDPRSIDWKSDRAPNFTIRQDSGEGNALGAVRIDMPNSHAVYMHDTNHKSLFSADYRFQSSGCARVQDVRDLAAWLLQDNTGWGRREIDAAIATGKRSDIRLARAVPVAWIYLTGWASRDGTIHFRNDVYGHDEGAAKQFMVDGRRPVAVSAVRASGFAVQSANPAPAVWKDSSYLDGR